MAIDASEIAAAQGQVKLLTMLGETVPESIQRLADLKPETEQKRGAEAPLGLATLGRPTESIPGWAERVSAEPMGRDDAIKAVSREGRLDTRVAAEVVDSLAEGGLVVIEPEMQPHPLAYYQVAYVPEDAIGVSDLRLAMRAASGESVEGIARDEGRPEGLVEARLRHLASMLGLSSASDLERTFGIQSRHTGGSTEGPAASSVDPRAPRPE